MPPNSVSSIRCVCASSSFDDDALGPRRVLDFDVERRAVAGEAIRVAQAGEDLVHDVPRRPETVQVESARADDPAAQLLEPDLAVHAVLVGLRADVAVALLVLHGLQLGDQVIGALLEAGVAGGGVHQAHRREVVARDVAGEIPAGPVPAAVALAPSARGRRACEGTPSSGRLRATSRYLAVEILGVLERPAGHAARRRARSGRAFCGTTGLAGVATCADAPQPARRAAARRTRN